MRFAILLLTVFAMKTLTLILLLICIRLHGATFDFGTDANPVTSNGVTVTLAPEYIFATGWWDYEPFLNATGFWDLARSGGVIESAAGQASISITAFEDSWIYGPASLGVPVTSRTTNGSNLLGQWVTSTYNLSTTGRLEFAPQSAGMGLIIDRVTVDVLTPTPQLSIASTPSVTVTWAGTGWTLLRKTTGDWQPVATESPAILPAVDNAIFKLTR